MRILILSESFSPELISTGKYTGELADWLAARGHNVRVVTRAPHYPQWKVFEGYSSMKFSREHPRQTSGADGSLDVFRCPVWIPSTPRGWRRVLYLMSFAASSWPAMLLQVGWRPDIVLMIQPTILCAPQALAIAWLSGAIGWMHVQDFEVDVAFQLGDFSSRRLRQWASSSERFLTGHFHRVSAISERMVERLKAKGVSQQRTLLFPNWVDTSAIYPLEGVSPLRQELGIPDDSVVVLYSGNMGMKQGLDLLADAARRLQFRTDIRFIFCGDGPYRKVLSKLGGELNNVSLLPLQPLERLNDLLNLADIHVLPQLAGAADLVMPSKLTGMMASGRAIVATADPDTQLARVLDGKGIVVKSGDTESLISALIRLADDPGLRWEMGEQAREHSISHMNRDDVLRKFEQSLLEVCGLSPAVDSMPVPDSARSL